MLLNHLLFLFATITTVISTPKDLRTLFPQVRQYVYEVTASMSVGTLTPTEGSTSWTLEGRLFAQLLGNESQVRFQLDDLKTSVNSENDGYISYQFEEEAKYLKHPWIVDYYKEYCLIESIYLPTEPAWVSNVKRALSLNFQLKSGDGFYTSYEPCVHDSSCFTTYLSQGNTVKKYTSLPSTPKFGSSWKSVPWMDPVYKHDQYLWNAIPDLSTMTAQRVYHLDEKVGLISMEMKSNMQYRLDDRGLFLDAEFHIQYETDLQAARMEWPKLTRSGVKHASEDCSKASCGIMDAGQGYLKERTFELLLRISKKGIDTDNIIKDSSIIHSTDFISLLNTMTQLNHTTLKVLFEDLVLGTSYDLETSRNIFLEVLPYTGTDASVRFIKYLVIEEKGKIEDSALLSLIRKLPFNTANYTQELIQELEPLTKLGFDFPQELRHAAILSFASLLHQTRRSQTVGVDYFDNMVVKYLRMYSDCPHYMDRLVWLQGLCNIGYTTQKYTMEIFTDSSKRRNERLWAAFASNFIENQYYSDEPMKATELLIPIMTNKTEEIQIRLAALHTFLTATSITQNDFLFVHNYVRQSANGALKRFWFTALKSLQNNKSFYEYKLASIFLPSVSDLVFDLDPDHWGTNNVIFSSENDPKTSMHLISMADDTGLPSFAGVRLSTAGKRASVYIVAEGIASNIYKRMHDFDESEMSINKLVEILKDLRVWAVKSTEEVHVDFVFKIQEKAVFVGHMNQTRFDSWNLIELAKSVNEFLRLGSHINQQVVYYPSHMELSFPNELGIPVRIQTTSISFTSIRGNLTAPATDLHIRYQGMAVTSLSTFGLLVQSEHSARIQKSMVAHIPLKFNISYTPIGVFNLKTDVMLPIQNGGVVIHTQTHVEKSTRGHEDLLVVRPPGSNQTQNRSIFSDCENSTFSSSLGSLFTGNLYSIFKYFQPSRVILNAITLIVSPPSSTCGVIHLHNAAISEMNKGIKATLLMENLPSIVDFFSGDKNLLKTSLILKDYRQDNDVSGEIVNIQIDFEIKNQDKNIITRLELNTTNSVHIFLENNDFIYTGDENTVLDSKYKSHISLGYYKEEPKDQKTLMDVFINTEKNPNGEKKLEIKLSHDIETFFYPYLCKLIPFCVKSGRIDTMTEMQLPQDIWVPIYFACVSESYKLPFLGTSTSNTEITAVLKDGLTSVAVLGSPHMRFKSSEITWWVDNWITLKKLTTFGLYKECRIRSDTVLTLSDTFLTFAPAAGDTVALADCTDIPRFAVLRQENGSLKVYAGGHSVTTALEHGQVTWKVNSTMNGDHFRILQLDNGVKIQSRGSGVQVYHRPDETVILLPNSHLHSVCGVCATG